MAPYAQGRPFNSGPVWDVMAFPQPGQGYTASQPYPLAGAATGYLDAFKALRASAGDLQGEDLSTFMLMGSLGLNAEQTRRANREFMQEMLKQRREESLEAKKLAREDAVMRSFLVDVPAAIGNAFGQRQRYAPETIQIAANAANRPLSGYGMPNYYGFVG